MNFQSSSAPGTLAKLRNSPPSHKAMAGEGGKMATEEKKLLDSVTTFVAELPGLPLAEVLKKFQGKHTARTLAAARRMCKKRQIKVPRNLIRQLWRITGGWGSLKNPNWAFFSKVTLEKKVAVGNMEIMMGSHPEWRDPIYYLAFRGEVVAVTENWRDANRLNDAFASLGVPLTPSQQG